MVWWQGQQTSTQGPQFDLCPHEIRCRIFEQDADLTPSFTWGTITHMTFSAKQRGRKQVCSTTSNIKFTIDRLGTMESPVGAQFSQFSKVKDFIRIASCQLFVLLYIVQIPVCINSNILKPKVNHTL